MRQSKDNTAHLLIDVQKGFQDPMWGKRNNLTAEAKIQLLLQFPWPVISNEFAAITNTNSIITSIF